MFEEIVAPTIKDLFIIRIEDLIFSGELKIGEKLPSERELAEKMKISKTAVHSGICDLQRKGFLKVVPRVGIFVEDYAANGTLEVLESIIRYGKGNFSNKGTKSILEIRIAIESIAVKNVISANDKNVLEKLKQIAARIKEEDDPAKLSELFFEFHHYICTSSGNIIIPLIMNAFKETAIRMWINSTRSLGLAESKKRIYDLLRYIEEKDEEKALKHIEWICISSMEIVND